jgi:molecular chaperone HtpG
MNNSSFKAGMYLLETLTSGMYNDPLSIYREYIQNSVDSIDQSGKSPENTEIKIELNPYKKSVSIHDNGKGITADTAENVLSSIGSSQKLGTSQRGFRGIGRLGGIAFAKKVVFRTTSMGESVISTQEWDCEELRKLLRSPEHSSMTIEELFCQVSVFSQDTNDEFKNISFFEVQLLEVESFRNYIFDIQRIKKYLVQVAPLPFDQKKFSFHNQIKRFLSENIPQYDEYKITVNGEQLFRQYSDELSIKNKQCDDKLESVKLFSLMSGEKTLAYGWYGNRRDFLGSIRKGSAVSGLRVKVGNLQVGDQHLLDRCFRENRFNSYIVGEIHIFDESLLPNSRRDDFVDNKEKTLLYNVIEREIGLPLSREIRRRSRINTKIPATRTPSVKKTSFADENVDGECMKKDLEQIKISDHSLTAKSDILGQLLNRCGECITLKQILQENQN